MIEIIDCSTFRALCFQIIEKSSSGDRDSEELRKLWEMIKQHRSVCPSCDRLLSETGRHKQAKASDDHLERLNEWLRGYQEIFGVSNADLEKLLTLKMLEVEQRKRKKKTPSS